MILPQLLFGEITGSILILRHKVKKELSIGKKSCSSIETCVKEFYDVWDISCFIVLKFRIVHEFKRHLHCFFLVTV